MEFSSFLSLSYGLKIHKTWGVEYHYVSHYFVQKEAEMKPILIFPSPIQQVRSFAQSSYFGHNFLLGHPFEVIQNPLERRLDELQPLCFEKSFVRLSRCSKLAKTEDVDSCTSCSEFDFCSRKSVLISVAILETLELPQVHPNTKNTC